MDVLTLEETHPGLIDALLGADAETLFREWGLTPPQVRRIRRALAPILPYWCDGLVPERPATPDHPALARHPGIEHVLGRRSDQDVAVRFGLSRERVRQLRTLAGVPSLVRPASEPRPPRPVDETKSPLQHWKDSGWKGPSSGWTYVARIRALHPGVIEALPALSTKEIERRFGLNKKGVRYLRAFLGIPYPRDEGDLQLTAPSAAAPRR